MFIYFSIVFNGIVIFIWKSFKSNHILYHSGRKKQLPEDISHALDDN